MVATVAVFVETGPNATPVETDTSALGPPLQIYDSRLLMMP